MRGHGRVEAGAGGEGVGEAAQVAWQRVAEAGVQLEPLLEVCSVWVRGFLLLLPALLLIRLLDVGLLCQLLLLLLLLLLFTQNVGDGEGYRLSLLSLQLCPWLGVICNGQCYL